MRGGGPSPDRKSLPHPTVALHAPGGSAAKVLCQSVRFVCPASAGVGPTRFYRQSRPTQLPRPRGGGPSKGWMRAIYTVCPAPAGVALENRTEPAIVDGLPRPSGGGPGCSLSSGPAAGWPRARGGGPDALDMRSRCVLVAPHARGCSGGSGPSGPTGPCQPRVRGGWTELVQQQEQCIQRPYRTGDAPSVQQDRAWIPICPALAGARVPAKAQLKAGRTCPARHALHKEDVMARSSQRSVRGRGTPAGNMPCGCCGTACRESNLTAISCTDCRRNMPTCTDCLVADRTICPQCAKRQATPVPSVRNL